MREVHIIDSNCGEDTPPEWYLSAYTLAAAEVLTGHNRPVCEFCRAACVGVEVSRAKGAQ